MSDGHAGRGRGATLGHLGRLIVDEGERRTEEGAHPAHLSEQAVVVAPGGPRDRAGLRACLLDDQLCLFAGLLLERHSSFLRRHERRPQKPLDLAITDEIVLELVDLVRQVGPLAPDVLEAGDDLVEQPIDRIAVVAADERLRRLYMSDLDWGERHRAPLSVQAVEDVDHDREKDVQERDADDRREVHGPERRQKAAPQPQIGIADVVQETLDPVQPHRVREPHPRRDDESEDQQRVDVDENPQEALDVVDDVVEQAEHGAAAHTAQFGITRACPCPAPQAWLKKPPRSSKLARSSAETSTFRGVSRKTLSATRCIPPSSAYVRPLAKSIRRLERSWSVLCK